MKSILSFHLAINKPDIKIENGTALIKDDIPEMFRKQMEEKIKSLIPSVKKVEYKKKEENKEKPPKEEKKAEEKNITSSE